MDATREALRKMVESHKKDRDTPLIFAAWYRTSDGETIHLLEVCEGVSNPGDASWMTLDFLTPPEMAIPAKRLKITYLSPGEFFDAEAMTESDGRKILDEIRRDGCDVLYVAQGNAEALKIEETVHATAAGRS